MTQFATPTTTYTPDDSSVSQAEREAYLDQLGAAKVTDLDAVEVKADQGISDAAAAQVTADAACPDNEAVKKTGNQTISDIKTFEAFPVISSAGTPSGSQVGNMTNVIAEIEKTGVAWSSITLLNGWTGSAKYRMDRWGYLEFYISLNGSLATDAIAFAIPSIDAPDYTYRVSLITIDNTTNVMTINPLGNIFISGYDTVGLPSYQWYGRIIKTAP